MTPPVPRVSLVISELFGAQFRTVSSSATASLGHPALRASKIHYSASSAQSKRLVCLSASRHSTLIVAPPTFGKHPLVVYPLKSNRLVLWKALHISSGRLRNSKSPREGTLQTQYKQTAQDQSFIDPRLNIITSASTVTASAATTRLATTPSVNTYLITASMTTTMSADDEYAAFLEKANADVSETGTGGGRGQTKEHKRQGFTDKSIDTEEREIPAVLKKVDEVYVSETDEKWEVVWLKCPDNSGLDKETIGHLTSIATSSIEILDPASFDPRDEYKAVIEAAATAASVSKKDIKVFRVELGHSRCEYWVVGLKEGKRLVGFRAKAVET